MSNYPFEANQDIDNQRSGIYAIVNIKNGKFYIGSAVQLKRRKTNHLWHLKNDSHQNEYLQRSWNKYGDSYFVFKVVEYCDIDALIIREQFYINEFVNTNILYNICNVAGSPLGRICTDETKKKISIANSNPSEETRAKRSFALKGNKNCLGKRIPAEVRLKMSLASKGKPKSEEHTATQYTPVIMIDKETDEEIREFVSLKSACNFVGAKSNGNISEVLNGNRQTAYGYKWKRK